MSQSDHPADRTFQCGHCHGEIRIPYDLPPTSAPCPHCQVVITSPAPPAPEPAAEEAKAPVKPVEPPVVPVAVEPAGPVSGGPAGGPGESRGMESRSSAAVQTATLAPSVLDIAAPAPDLAVPAPAPPVASSPAPASAAPASTPAAPAVPAPEAPAPPAVPVRVEPEAPARPAVVPAPAEPSVSAAAAPATVGELLDDEDLRDEVAQVGRPAAPVVPASKSPNVTWFILAMLLVIVGLVILGLYLMRAKEPPPPENTVDRARIERNRFLREGWKADASRQLQGFLAAETVDDKARYVIGGEAKLEEMREFYAEPVVEGRETPLDSFGFVDLPLQDRERGLFLMQYERPAQFNMREFFRPVAPLEVQYDVAEPDVLLSSFAMFENFASDPVRVMAFFKQEGDVMKLDWDVFVQTKYRRLRDFSSLPQPGAHQTFRVLLEEDLSDTRDAAPDAQRFYRLSDPYHRQDHVKVRVAVGSRLGQNLAGLNWVGLAVDAKPSRTATVVLEWTGSAEPELRLRELVCWEFLNLGGVPGNAEAVSPDRSETAATAPPGRTPPPATAGTGALPARPGDGKAE